MDDIKTNKKLRQFVKCQHKMNSDNKEDDEEVFINYIDKAVYCYLRKYMDKDTFTTFVSLGQVAEDFGVSRPTVNKSINKLLEKNIISRSKQGRGYVYTFTDKRFKNFEKISMTLLNNKKLPAKIRAFCISLQEYLTDKDTGIGKCVTNSTQMAKNLGMSYDSYRKYIKECKSLGLITNDESELVDFRNVTFEFDLEKLGQAILFVNEKVDKNTKDIDQLKEEIYQIKEILKNKNID